MGIVESRQAADDLEVRVIRDIDLVLCYGKKDAYSKSNYFHFRKIDKRFVKY